VFEWGDLGIGLVVTRWDSSFDNFQTSLVKVSSDGIKVYGIELDVVVSNGGVQGLHNFPLFIAQSAIISPFRVNGILPGVPVITAFRIGHLSSNLVSCSNFVGFEASIQSYFGMGDIIIV
jgi:hypothetical protein